MPMTFSSIISFFARSAPLSGSPLWSAKISFILAPFRPGIPSHFPIGIGSLGHGNKGSGRAGRLHHSQCSRIIPRSLSRTHGSSGQDGDRCHIQTEPGSICTDQSGFPGSDGADQAGGLHRRGPLNLFCLGFLVFTMHVILGAQGHCFSRPRKVFS